jgi:hypothetical protein
MKPDARVRTDVWALGVTLLELPAPSKAAVAGVLQAVRLPPSAPQRQQGLATAAAWLPANVRGLITGRMLAHRPHQRATLAKVRQHAFFAGVDWQAGEARRVPLPQAVLQATATGKAMYDQVAAMQPHRSSSTATS